MLSAHRLRLRPGPWVAMISAGLLRPMLARSARAILDTHKPLVVGVSGSVGKTSTKDAVSRVLREWRSTMCSPENQNDELGVPLSVMGVRPSRSFLGWIAMLRSARRLESLTNGSYPRCLVLEFGSCHVGDVEALMKLTTPEVGVLTAIQASHLASYGSLDAIEQEEGKVVTMLPSTGVGVVNIDDPGAARAAGRASCRIVTYGFDAMAEVRGIGAESSIDWDQLTGRVHLDVRCDDESGSLTIEGMVGSHGCHAPLAALAVARAIGIPFGDAMRALRDYTPPEGRMRCVRGINDSIVINDSYNSSPVAAAKALETLAEVGRQGRRGELIAVLGPMSELGPTSALEHARLGRHAATLGIDRVFTVGEEARATARAARDAGMPGEHVCEFMSTTQAIGALRERARARDVVLVKGSRSAGMDRVVTALRHGTVTPASAPTE